MRKFIVDETSAVLGCQDEKQQNVDRNHFDICKFSGVDDPAYQVVGPNLKGMTDRARQRRIECAHTQEGMYIQIFGSAAFSVLLLF